MFIPHDFSHVVLGNCFKLYCLKLSHILFLDFFYFRSCCDFVDVLILNANLNCIYFVMFKIVIHACYRRSKAFDSLCLLLYTVMPSLNKISYLILYEGM